MIVAGLLDYNLLIGRDNVYNIEAIVSTLFQVMCFQYEGKIVTIDQLSFPGTNIALSQSSLLNGPFTSMVSLETSFHPPDNHE